MAFGKEEWEALKSTAEIASSLCQKLADLGVPKSQYPIPHNLESSIPELILSVPHQILTPISTLPVPDDLKQALLAHLHDYIGNLQRQYRSSYNHSCQETFRITSSFADINDIHKTYEALSRRDFIPKIESQITFIVSEVAKRQYPVSENRRSFNNDFTPVLEKYFELNGYPSIAHRTILAQKSGMIPRQIEVWFQNHRNRAKKENLVVPRLSSDLPLRQALVLLECDTTINQNRLLTPPLDPTPISIRNNEKQGEPSSQEPKSSQTSPISQPTFLDKSYRPRPPHAFPTTTSMKSFYPDPFPNDEGVFKFPRPVWKRTPATEPIVSVSVDMDDFAQMFHLKLNFAENSRRRGNTPLVHTPSSSQAWFTATTTIPSPAPHPSFIPFTLVSQPPQRSVQRPLPGSDIRTSEPTFGSSSLPVSITPSSEPSTRKIRPLPRRIPPRSRSNPFGSRNSSFGSDTSSGSGISSSSSNYSSSPELSTPPPLPNLDLPVLHDEDRQHDLFYISQTGVDPGYSSPNILPSQDFIPPNAYPCPNKFSDDFSFFDNVFPDFSHNLGEIFP